MTKSTKRISILTAVLFAVLAFAVGLSFMAKPVSAATDSNFFISEQAQVRLDGTKGIRFLVGVNNDYYDNLTKEGTYAGYTSSLHVAMIPTTMLNGAELNATTQYKYENEDVQTLIINLNNPDADNSTATETRYNASLMNIPSVSYETRISARAFIKLEKAGETAKYIYTDTTAVRSIGEVATAYYNDPLTDEVDKALTKTLLETNLGTVAFAEESVSVKVGESTTLKVLGNKYGFELDESALSAKGAVLESDSAKVEIVNGYSIKGVSTGSANVTITIGEKSATIPVTVADVEKETDSTEKFSWEADNTTTVTRTNEGYEIYAVQGTKIEYSEEISLAGLNEFMSISSLINQTVNSKAYSWISFRFADAYDSNYGFSLLVHIRPDNPTKTFIRTGALNQTDYLGDVGTVGAIGTWTLANSEVPGNDLCTTQGTMTFRLNSDSCIQYNREGSGWYRGTDKAVKVPTNAFSEENTNKNVKLTIDFLEIHSTTTPFGIVIKKLDGESFKIAQTLTDTTGNFSWKENDGISVNQQSFTWTNSTLKTGNKTSPWTCNDGYKVITSGDFVDVVGAGTINLNTVSTSDSKSIIQFAGITLPTETENANKKSGEPLSGDKTIYIRLTDATDSKKVLTFTYCVPDGYTGSAVIIRMGFNYTNGTTTIGGVNSNSSQQGTKVMTGYNMGNSYNSTYYKVPELKYLGDYNFSFDNNVQTWEYPTGSNLKTQLQTDTFGANGVKLSVSSGTTAGMYVINFHKA